LRFQVRYVAAAAAALLVTLGLLLAGQRWLFSAQTTQPLQAQLERVPGVKSVALDFAQQPGVVHVTLSRVPDLETTYQDIDARVQALAPGATITLPTPTEPRLRSAEQDLSFYVAQGLATGQFVGMRRDVIAQATRDGVRARIYIDAHNVYLALYDGAHAGYFIYPREAK